MKKCTYHVFKQIKRFMRSSLYSCIYCKEIKIIRRYKDNIGIPLDPHAFPERELLREKYTRRNSLS